jgi:hypothetical protein
MDGVSHLSINCPRPPNPHSSEEAVAAINDAEQQLEMLKRQVVLGQMYPSARSVME